MDDKFSGSTAALVAKRLFYENTRLTERLFQVLNLAQEIVLNNPRRVELLIINPSQGDVTISTDPKLVVNNGILIPAGGGSLILSVLEDGESVAERWFSYCAAGAVNVYVFEVETI